jgi:hypothetical protein
MAGTNDDNGSRLRDQADGLIGARRTAAADELADLSDALRGASDQLRARSRSMVAGLAQATADRIEDLAVAIRERDLGELLDEAQRFARRQPEVFFVGAVALGFVLTRALRGAHAARHADPAPARTTLTPTSTAGV